MTVRSQPPVAVVTGAAAGIGAATAHALAESGYAVALWDLDEAAASSVADLVAGIGREALAVGVDVGDHDSVHEALTLTRRRLGTPTAVVTAAGIMAVHPFLELPVDSWTRTLRVNLTGTFLVLQACASAMADDGLPGAMVAMSSVAGRGPRADAADYAASKAAVISVVQSAAVALAPHRIRVNALCPGMVDTPMTQRNTRRRAQVESRSPEDVAAAMLAKIPLGRLSTPKEIADIATLLIGENFNYVTGQAINVCGGLEFD